jgi:flagellar biosynthetic protein FliQ
MTESLLIKVMHLTIQTAALLTAPLIVSVMVVGLASQAIQTVTQLRDQSLAFVPKVFVGGVVFLLLIPWYLQLIQKYVEIIFAIIGKASQ